MQWTFIEIRKYFIVLFALFYDVSPFFALAYQRIWPILILLLLTNISRKELNSIPKKIIYIILFVYFLIFLQGVLYGGFSPAAIYIPIMYFFTPYLLYKYLGLDYIKKLFNIIYVLSVFGVIIWLFQPLFYEKIQDAAVYVYENNLNWDTKPRSLLFYTYEKSTIKIGGLFINRNAGFCHEPGAFSIYLMLAILLDVFLTRNYFTRKSVLLMLILLTTFSTAGYILLFVYLIYSTGKIKINMLVKPLIFAGMLILIYYTWTNSQFLDKKVETYYQDQTQKLKDEDYGHRGRFYSFGRSISFFRQSPVIGRGIITKTRFEEIQKHEGIGYGFANLFMKYGVIFGLIYMFWWYKGFKALSVIYKTPISFSIIAFIIVNLALLSQGFFYHVSFVYFFIFGLLESKKYKRLSKIKTDM